MKGWFSPALLAGVLAAVGPVACTSSQTGSIPAAATPDVAQTSTLQFAVGTATIARAGGASSVGLNVVATFRQPNGNNATNINTPTLTAPAGVHFGPLLGGSNVVGGVTPAALSTLVAQARAVPKGEFYRLPASFSDGFGPLVGVFGYGLAADNLVSSTDLTTLNAATGDPFGQFCEGVGTNYFAAGTNNPIEGVSTGFGAYYGLPPAVGVTTSNLVRSAELALPIPSGTGNGNCTCPSTCAPNGTAFVDGSFPVQYFGGPPAWPSPQGYGNYSYFVGYPLGFTTFTAAPAPGTYGLSVAYPTNPTYSAFGSIAKTARLASVAPLPVLPQPALTINADGSGVVNVDVPAGLRETVITIITNDCDLTGRDLSGFNYYNHYALETQRTGPQALFLSAKLGPPGSITKLPTHTFCTVSDVQAFNAVAGLAQPVSSFLINTNVAAVGFDYAAVEASYPFNMSATPPITNGDGHSGQADVTTSYPSFLQTTLTVPAGS